jgi:hypothetical protein
MSRVIGWWGCDNCSKMHRRAQAAESAAAKAIRQNDHAQLWKTVDYLRRYVATREARCNMWIGRYRELKKSGQAPGKDSEAK